MQANKAKPSNDVNRPRLWAFGLIGLVCLAVIAWSIFWGIAARQTLATLNSWMEREGAAGRFWSCEDKQIGGYPLDIEVLCLKPQFKGDLFGKRMNGDLTGFRAAAKLWRPGQITALLQAPFRAQTDDGDYALDLSWSDLKLVLEGDPHSFGNLWLQTNDVALQPKFPSLAAMPATADHVEAHVTKLADHAYGFEVTIAKGWVSAFDTLFGSRHSPDFEFSGIITEADLSKAGQPLDLIEAWRQKQGEVALKSARLTEANMKMEAQGTLGLDPEHRLQGRLEAQLTGVEPILNRFGINPVVLDAGSLLNNLLGKQPKPGSAEEKKTLHVPLSFSKGWLAIGPLRTPVALLPLY